PRGPVRLQGGSTSGRRSVAVAVESFSQYRRLFGGFEGPGRLPFAVASFFEQGGRRAYVVRVVHGYGDPLLDAAGVARGLLGGVVVPVGEPALLARSEGSWGNRLRAALGWSVAPHHFEAASTTSLVLSAADGLPAGTLLRLTLPGGARLLRFVSDVIREERPDSGGYRWRAIFEAPSPAVPEAIEIVEGVLAVDDGDGRIERHAGLGLSALHPRWMASVLAEESELVAPDPSWVAGDLRPVDGTRLPADPVLPAPEPPQFGGGVDRYADVVPGDFFDDGWVLGDPDPGDGVHALVQLDDLSSVVVPDLYSPGPLVPPEPLPGGEPQGSGGFEPCLHCLDEPEPAPEIVMPDLAGLLLDPRDPMDLETITGLQLRLAGLAERLGRFIVLLDVPPGLSQRQILRWRSRFATSWAAAYHPWLRVSRADDRRDALIRVNPSAVAAGLIARQELLFGVPHGPANALAAGVVDVDERVSPARHDELHPAGVNVWLRERDGVRLTAARTLARDARYRQLSVRRLMLMLRRALEQQTQWMVFEPNGPALRGEVRNLLRLFLRQLFRAGAFRGATEAEAFFVRCDEELNPPRVVDRGELIAEVGVAPAEPMEFLVVRLARGADWTVTVEV
ncbi:MAG TPA: phage tail sheath C-terminal domain-containing protein, partial [Thermoanaerobaculia bacterium]|nr:phage tail sheath C-terminal domain-containing protein [Thermoanaerobaculia bacterium]